MPEPKLISPLLDGFTLGPAMSHHDGVRCCPALKENSTKKYIVKIISIPASQVQLDVFLLTGAYREPSAALEYFRELSEEVEKEAEALKSLAKLEGFLSYDRWQVVPMGNGNLGYEVYLLGTYKRSLEKFMRRETLTHLNAVNLGIDICDALSAARRAGWIYADLKPSNIFISENNEFRIGDLGLLPLEGLELASLPGKYRSAYTAPEMEDDLLSPNSTMDTYALGLILYQIYNNGQLPQVPHPTEDLPSAPVNADPELAQIILRALEPDPAQRWEDPSQMGQSLVAYMQRNRVNNDPILAPLENAAPADDTIPDAISPEESTPEVPDITQHPDGELPPENAPAEDTPAAESPADAPAQPDAENAPEDATFDETLAKLDSLIAQPVPEINDPDDGEMPAPEPVTPPDGEPPRESEKEEPSAPEPAKPDTAAPETPAKKKKPKADKEKDLTARRRRRRRKMILIPLAIFLLLAMLCAGALWYYQEIFLLRVNSLTVTGSENHLTVRLDTQADTSLLQITCTDANGKILSSPVVQGEAAFTDLQPDMIYSIQVQAEGFHKLDGCTSQEYVTPGLTRITGFTAATGSEDGSVVLNFEVEGPDSDEWVVSYGTAEASLLTRRFSGHTLEVTGLTVGETYTFRVEPVNDLYMAEDAVLEFTASQVILAEKISIVPQSEDTLTVNWSCPENAQVESWDVYCYSIDGYESRITVTKPTASFSGIRSDCAYTVEVTAAGMTLAARASISANPIQVTDFTVTPLGHTRLQVNWEFQGETPANGWLLLYTIDGNGRQQVVQCPDNSGIVEIRVPEAAYDFTIQSADGRTVFNGLHSYTAPEAEWYGNKEQLLFIRENHPFLFVNLLKTPEKTNWNHKDVHRSQFTTNFRVGDPISIHIYFMADFYIRHENIQVLYVIRDESGKVIYDSISLENRDWRSGLWSGPDYHYCCLNLPYVPAEAGNYNFSLYFDGQLFTSVDFTIQE